MFLNFRKTLANFLCPELEVERRAADRAANIDDLTGAANRRALKLATPAAIADKLAFILFDANNFGRINKEAGHAAGDDALIQMSKAITDAAEKFGHGARVFRQGGDEFVVICPRHIAGAIRDIAEQNFGAIDFGSFIVSISGTVGDTVEQADTTLQIRKKIMKDGKFLCQTV